MFAVFEKFVQPYPDAPPAPPPKTFLPFVWSATHGLRRHIAGMTLFTAAIGVFEALLFAVLGKIVDWLGPLEPARLWAEHRGALLLLGAVLLASTVLMALQSLFKHQALAGNFPMLLRWNFHRLMLRQSMHFYQDEFAGRIATKVMQTALAVRDIWMILADILVFVLIYFVTMVAVVGGFDRWLLLPFLSWVALYVVALRYFVPRLAVSAKAQADARSLMTGRITDAYTNIATVKLFSHAGREAGYARAAMQEFLITVHRQMRLVTGFEVVNHLLGILLILATAGATLALWMQGQVGVGALAAATAMALRLNGISHWVMWEMASLFEQVGTVQDGIRTLAQPHAVVDRADAVALRVERGDIRIEEVSFHYGAGASGAANANALAHANHAGAGESSGTGARRDANARIRRAGDIGPDGNPVAGAEAGADAGADIRLASGASRSMARVIDRLSLHVRPGEKIGLVGRSGAGKSTLVNLLLRFHDIQSGRILIDGQDIAGVTQDSLRAQIGMVTQDTSLLHRSVRDNILYGRPDATDAQMGAAARRAEAEDFILGLTDPKGRTGYEAHVGERGVKLSGGQRQRIAIARVMLKDAPILLLDEATSALDSEVEAAIQASLYRLMEGKTVVAIAHRLSTIAAMDRLIVLDKGRIVEQGDHRSLLAQGGLYARLWAHQSGGFLGEQDEDDLPAAPVATPPAQRTAAVQ